MKLTTNTIEILKNFSTINQSILFEKGDLLMTRNPASTVVGIAKLDQEIEQKFAIYDLPQLLSVLSLYKQPEIKFKDDYLLIGEDNRNVKYTYTQPNYINAANYEKLKSQKLPFEVISSFTLTADQIQKTLKAAAILNLPNIQFVSSQGNLDMVACDVKNPTSHKVMDTVSSCDVSYSVNYQRENLNILVDDYTVSIYSAKMTKLESDRVIYYIAADIVQ